MRSEIYDRVLVLGSGLVEGAVIVTYQVKRNRNYLEYIEKVLTLKLLESIFFGFQKTRRPTFPQMNHFAIRPERKRRTEPERKEPVLEGSVVVAVAVAVVVAVFDVVVGKSQSPDSNCIVDRACSHLFFIIFATFFHFSVRGSNSRMASK